jgi:hypothetical protein
MLVVRSPTALPRFEGSETMLRYSSGTDLIRTQKIVKTEPAWRFSRTCPFP